MNTTGMTAEEIHASHQRFQFADMVAAAVVARMGRDDSGLLRLAEKMKDGGYSLGEFIMRAKGEAL